jgi:hypothetical protein
VPGEADVGGVAEPGGALQLPERAAAGSCRERRCCGVQGPLRALGIVLHKGEVTLASEFVETDQARLT